ncbi:MAG: effector binding domain-containing protein [Oceanicoccus sp.]
MKPKIVEKPSFTVVGLSLNTSMEKQSGDGYALWQKFLRPDFVHSIPKKVNPNVVFSLHTDWNESKGTYIFTLGFEVSETTNLSKDLSAVHIPDSTYTVFTATGLMPDAAIKKWQEIADWRKNTKQRSTGIASF